MNIHWCALLYIFVSNYWICYLGEDDVYLLLNAGLLKNMATKG